MTRPRSGSETKKLGKASRRDVFLLQLKEKGLLGKAEEEYHRVLSSPENYDELRVDDAALAILDDSADLGVSEFKNLSTESLLANLGISPSRRTPFPFLSMIVNDLGSSYDDSESLNTYKELLKQAPDASLDNEQYEEKRKEWDAKLRAEGFSFIWPRWHQLVGLSAIVKRFFEGKNVLLADGVGVGKTLQAFMTMAYLRFLKTKNMGLSDEAFEPPISESV